MGKPMATSSGRSRKAHQKSRSGCGNCKLRRVKCDEVRPTCRSCVFSGYSCDYNDNVSSLASSHDAEAKDVSLSLYRCSTNRTVLGNINTALRESDVEAKDPSFKYELGLDDLAVIYRYQTRTFSSSTPTAVANVLNHQIFGIIGQNSCLMHAAMTLTLMHDRYLLGQAHQQRSMLESYHWASATHLFRETLATKRDPTDKIALWLTASSLSWISLSAVETNSIEDVWPLKPAAESDLNWLEMQKGMRLVWSMVRGIQIYAADSKGGATKPNFGCIGLAPPAPGIEGLPLPFIDLCKLDPSSDANTNPYHTAAHILSQLLREADNYASPLRFLAFPNMMDAAFATLLRRRDTRALLLMAIWYELVPPSFWWIDLRVSLERESIWTYLARRCTMNPCIHKFVTTYTASDLCSDEDANGSRWLQNLTIRLRSLNTALG